MSENVSIINYFPSLVARPYLLIKDDHQRKDYQRFWFENTVSFLACVSAAQLVQVYNELQDQEDSTDIDQELIKFISEHASLTNVGLEHMSLGKWVMMLRETTKVLNENKFKSFTVIPELIDFYHGKHGKDNAKLIDKLVSIRNNDAHGEPIPDHKIQSELDQRQKIIDQLIDRLGFLQNYEIILPESFEVKGTKQVYLCKEFKGNGAIISEREFNFSPALGEVMVYNQKQNRSLTLSPLILYLGVQESEKSFLGVFSKFTSSDNKKGKYLNLDGSAEINFESFGADLDIDLMSQRVAYNAIYSDPESYQENLQISAEFDESSVNKGVESFFTIKVENTKSIDLYDFKLMLDLPKQMSGIVLQEYKDITLEFVNQQLLVTTDKLDNETIQEFKIQFELDSQGLFELKSSMAYYQFHRNENDRQNDVLSDAEMENFIANEVLCLDPNSVDKLQPVININKRFINSSGDNIGHIKIGEDFVFELMVKNIGFSSAKNIAIDLVIPEFVNLKDGKETIKLKQLNPFEEQLFQYVFVSKKPGLYTLTMQNIIYSDINDNRFSTRLSDDYFIIVQSDRKKQFVYSVNDHIEDLFIDDKEKENIYHMIDDISDALEIDGKKLYQEAETEAVINILRKTINDITVKNNLKVSEFIYEESKRDSKLTGNGIRKLLVFSHRTMPFFAINLTKGYNPDFYGMNSFISSSPESSKVSKKMAVVARGSYTLDNGIDFSDIKYDEKYGLNFFKKWLGMIIKKISSEYAVWKDLSEALEARFNIRLGYISGQFFSNLVFLGESNVDSMGVLFDRTKKLYFVNFCYTNARSKNYKKYIQTEDSVIPLTFLKDPGPKDRSREFDSKYLSFYRILEQESKPSITRNPAVYGAIRNESDFERLLDHSKQLWDLLCFIHSLDIIESDFSQQEYLDEIKEYIYELFKLGFALRQDKKNRKKMEIYSLNEFLPSQATPMDCIGFLDANYKKWFVYVDFFEDDVGEALAGKLSLISSGNVIDKVRWIRAEIEDLEGLQFIVKAQIEQAMKYKKNKLAVWPELLQREMILDHGQTDSGFFLLLKCIMDGKDEYSEILGEFKILGIENELDRTLKQNDLFVKSAGYEQPLEIVGEGDDRVIGVKPFLKNTVHKLYQEDSNFNYLEPGNALNRILTIRLLKESSIQWKTPHNSGKTYSQTEKDRVLDFYFASQVNSRKNILQLTAYFEPCSADLRIEDFYERLCDNYSYLKNTYPDIEFESTGRVQKNFKIDVNINYNDFDLEIEKLRKKVELFFEQIQEGFKNFV